MAVLQCLPFPAFKNHRLKPPTLLSRCLSALLLLCITEANCRAKLWAKTFSDINRNQQQSSGERMDCSKMVERITSLYQKGFLDDQFLQLQQLQDESNPEFMAEVVGLYFEDSERLLEELTKALAQDPTDFKTADAYVHQFKGSSSSIGVRRVKNVCLTFRSFCEANNLEGCWQALQQLKQEYVIVKNELEDLFEVHKEAIQADGIISEAFSPLVVQSGESL